MTPGTLARATSLPRSTTAVAAGVGVLGLASFGYLVVAGRALGPERFGTVAIYWVVLNTLGAGLFLPLEQHVSRELAAGADVDGRRVLRRALGIAGAVLVLLTVVAGLGRRPVADAFFGGSTSLVAVLVAGTAAMAASYTCRGAFAGLGSWQRYGTHLALDGLVRFAGACLLALSGSDTVLPYAAVIVVGLVVSTVATVPGAPRPAAGGRPAPWGDLGRTLGWLLIASVSGLALLNAAPLAVELLADGAGTAATVGNFVAALTLARIPLFLFSAVQASLLPALSRHVGTGDRGRFAATLRSLTLGILGLGVVTGAVALAVGPQTLRLVFGPAFAIDRVDVALLAVSTAGLMLVTTLGQALIATARYRSAALAPLLGVAVFAVASTTGDAPLERRVSVALLLSVTVTVLALAAQVRVAGRAWAGAE
jgi:O-antigen/teichoic acid export membrane protein